MNLIKSKSKALDIAKAASSKKALDTVIIDMRGVPSVADYFVVTSGASSAQVRAITDNIIKQLKRKRQSPWHVEGKAESLWVLVDYGDVIAHIFYDETRHFYNPERLWGDAPQEHFKEKVKARKIRYGSKRRKTSDN